MKETETYEDNDYERYFHLYGDMPESYEAQVQWISWRHKATI